MSDGFGAFGKMPALGDFIRIGLPSAFITPWDTWLQDGLGALKSELADRWQDCFFSAPIWRFSIAPGLAGDRAMQGVLMASVDRVGRQFPLTLAAPCAGGHLAGRHLSSAGAFLALEHVALAALDDSATKESLTEAMAELPAWPDLSDPTPTEGGGLIVRGEHALAASLAAGAPLLSGAQSVWSAILDGEERLVPCQGLPGPRALHALFDLDAPYWTGAAA